MSASHRRRELISTVRDLLVYGRATAMGEGLRQRKQQRVRLGIPTKPPPQSQQLSYGIGLVRDKRGIGHN